MQPPDLLSAHWTRCLCFPAPAALCCPALSLSLRPADSEVVHCRGRTAAPGWGRALRAHPDPPCATRPRRQKGKGALLLFQRWRLGRLSGSAYSIIATSQWKSCLKSTPHPSCCCESSAARGLNLPIDMDSPSPHQPSSEHCSWSVRLWAKVE